ncbi:MAG: DUF2098 domain-containing protein [Methanomassiliicoccales archaeon]|nr:DUF2098 domain-containing protein [Methanomassiliicoccales archaeon]NYT14968.1 DUF2098 domain-containing protein [Methanomassiliicoccales archaeon]
MEVGDYARYVNTGTVGIIQDIKDDRDVTWALLDVTDLYYDVEKLEKASPDEYKRVTDKEKTLDERLQELRDMRESMVEFLTDYGDISPDGT